MTKYIDFALVGELVVHDDVHYEDLKRIPAADVVEVRHGRWVMDETPHDGDCRCSVCRVAIEQMHERHHGLLNALTGGKWWTFYRYCPHCGAQMDLEKNNE